MTIAHSEAGQVSVEEASASSLCLLPVETDIDVEAMRQIRNSVRHCMTRYNDEITKEQQRKWWDCFKDKPDVVRCFLLKKDYEPIGYGLIRRDTEDRQWITGALLEEYRGNGYGRFLFCSLANLCEGECWLEVWEDNVPAKRLYESLGFDCQWCTVVGNGDRILMTMKRE